MSAHSFDVHKDYIIEKTIYENEAKTTTVFEAKDRILDRTVVLKRIKFSSRSEQEDILKEVRNQVLLSNHSDFVPHVYNVYLEKNMIWIEMSKAVGKSLRAVIDETMSTPKFSSWYKAQFDTYMSVCESVKLLHNLPGFVHKDLKPENIIINRKRNTAYVIDFGISGPGVSKGIGTESYMAPEQRRNVDMFHVSQATDVFALGLIGVELFRGEVFRYGSDLALNPIKGIWQCKPDFGQIDFGEYGRMGSILEKCLEADPKKRYQNAGELCRELKSCGYSSKNGKANKNGNANMSGNSNRNSIANRNSNSGRKPVIRVSK